MLRRIALRKVKKCTCCWCCFGVGVCVKGAVWESFFLCLGFILSVKEICAIYQISSYETYKIIEIVVQLLLRA